MNTIILSIMLLLNANPTTEKITISELSPGESHIRWYIVNDGVMGGLSKGKFKYSDHGTGLFSGDISLDNNGGFSWLKGYYPEMQLDKAQGIKIRLKGDGRKFGFTVMNNDRRRVLYFASEIDTQKDQWQEIDLPLDQFKGYFYGQNVNAVTKMNKGKMNEVGFILFDKKRGPFQLEIDWIRIY